MFVEKETVDDDEPVNVAIRGNSLFDEEEIDFESKDIPEHISNITEEDSIKMIMPDWVMRDAVEEEEGEVIAPKGEDEGVIKPSRTPETGEGVSDEERARA